jgi:hypothetical protein
LIRGPDGGIEGKQEKRKQQEGEDPFHRNLLFAFFFLSKLAFLE